MSVKRADCALIQGNRRRHLHNNLVAYAFISPLLILFLTFVIYPVFEGFHLSLFDRDFYANDFVGFANYVELFEDPIFYKALYNTLIYMVFVTAMTIGLGFLMGAAIYDKNEKYMAVIRGSVYLPVIMSMVVMSIIWTWMLKPALGLIPYIMESLGMEPVNFLGDKEYALATVTFMIWYFQIGQAVMLNVAAMLNLNGEIIESAQIDGAGKLMVVSRILWPLVKPVTTYVLITTLINVMRSFSVINLMTSGGPYYRTINLMYMCYTTTFTNGRIGYGACIGTVMFVVVFILSSFRIKSLVETA